MREVTIMTKYREIIRLAGLNLSQSNIALSCNVSKTSVNNTLKAAKEKNIVWPLDPHLTDDILEKMLFPEKADVSTSSTKRMPDYAYIRKELLRNGVNKSFCGGNTWRNAGSPETTRSCIPSSAITSSRMSRNAAPRCTSTVNLGNR